MICRITLAFALMVSPFAVLAVAEPPRSTQQFVPGALGMTVSLITSHEELDANLGRLVAVRGPIARTKVPTILGVDIRNSEDLDGNDAYAVGILVRHEPIEEALRRSGPLAARHPGVTYALYFNLSGKLADARLWPDAD